MPVTDAEMLESARTALKALLDGGTQSYSINGRVYNALSIDSLKSLVADLEAKVNRSTRGAFQLGVFGCG